MELNNKLHVYDNFCEYPEEFAASVYEAGFATWLPNKGEVGSSKYEGMGFWASHALGLRDLIRNTEQVVVPNSMFFRSTNVGMEKAYIHSDRESGAHTCIVYLSEHEEESGTAFYRHIPTGLIEMPSFAEMREMGIMDQMKVDMVSRDPSKWEQIGYVEGKYNRGIVFEAPLFHSRYPLEGIGSSADDGRLVWVTHFYKLAGDGTLF